MTICVKNRELLFNNSEIKSATRDCWLAIPEHYPNVMIDEFIIMPNHIHGIIIVGAQLIASNANQGVINHTPTLRQIIRSFKAASTYSIRKNGHEYFAWQRNYYEHIIRNETDLNNIRKYIIDNPINWDKDENNPQILLEAQIK